MPKIKSFSVTLDEAGNGSSVSVSNWEIARNISWEDFADILSDKLNGGSMDGGKEGIAFGTAISADHPTLQRQAVGLLLSAIRELGKKQYTDDRNRDAIATCKKIGEMIDAGELRIGMYI